MNYMEPIKAVAGFVVSSGVTTIVGQSLRNTIPKDASRLKKIVMGIGAIALSSLVSTKVSDYVDEQLDELNSNVRKVLKIDKDAIVEAAEEFTEKVTAAVDVDPDLP